MEQYIGEIRAVSFPFAPSGWAQCNGQLLQIQQNQALFSLLGTTYGGDGVRTFGLPNLQGRTLTSYGRAGRIPIALGQVSGSENTTMTVAQLPIHSHLVSASTTTATATDPTGAVWAAVVDSSGTTNNEYTESAPNVTMAPTALTQAGSSHPISLLQPYTVINYIIATMGIFPPRD